MTYTLTAGTSVIRDIDGAYLPPDPANQDYATYEAWVSAGNTATPAPIPPTNWAALARPVLDDSDNTVLRCLENGVPVPAEWASYRTALRAIISGRTQVTVLPARPAYPAGT